MSSLVAEMLLRDPDADVTSPNGLPAVTGNGVDPENESDEHDAVGLDMARLIEVRSSVAPPAPAHFASADDSADIRALRSRRPRVVAAVVVMLVLIGFVAAALSLSR